MIGDNLREILGDGFWDYWFESDDLLKWFGDDFWGDLGMILKRFLKGFWRFWDDGGEWFWVMILGMVLDIILEWFRGWFWGESGLI